ncbi:MAG TPA: ABC transporter ATP-binding protein [Streptosporangiaceae bacterium]|nr:ABC transporter ATP-binding protein [Streptosporangiaceae bacterium]
MMKVRGLSKEYGKGEATVHALRGVDLDVTAGETVAVTGPSGCGKSTLLHVLGCLDRPTAGEVWIGQQRVDRMSERGLAGVRRHAVGFVFQSFQLMDELTAQENVELPALVAGRAPRAARLRAAELLERVGLADRSHHLPAQLSGGQCQRVAIARALVNDPLVVLADEPTGNLDSAATGEVLGLFERLRSGGLTLVVVTHDAEVAATADRGVAMRDGLFVGTASHAPSQEPRVRAITRAEV